ncbi:LuxR C-terminal-related transcriptional regulator [Nonomuraea sp. NPDC050790]|uniref:helix-turn-helix transcriptional regulator n=1 Tax=Nonomuraea sp. NPDC050790 TaxID=3364371 RepID=UPI0037BA5AA9
MNSIAAPVAETVILMWLAGREQEARAMAEHALAGHRGEPGLETHPARLLLDAGRLAEARAAAEADPGPAARYVLGRVALYTGDRQAVARFAAEGRRMTHDPSAARIGAWMLALAADDPSRAMTFATAASGSDGTPVDAADDVAYVRMALRAGERPAAADMARLAGRRAALDPGAPFQAAVAAHARGLLGADAALLARAAELLADCSRPIARASALEDAGRALTATERQAAVGHLDAALSLYEQAGATREAARARRRLREAGIRRRGRASGATHGWAGLTAAELQVVRLVARGATNRQAAERLYLSPHTVSTHLRHAYTKLDVNSRVELTRLVVEHDG